MANDPITESRRWIETIVIGLNLCPFARRVFEDEKIRYAISEATDTTALLEDLTRELLHLVAEPIERIETTILIHPHVLKDFLDYNDFQSDAEELIESMELTGVVQIASFHPHYRFAGTKPNAVENYTNRSPFPMLHLLREESITKVASDPAALEAIPVRNIETLRRLGLKKLQEMLKPIS